jgi:hypothetical protein
MDSQLNELSKGDNANENPNRYNLGSKKKEGKLNFPKKPTKAKNHDEDVARRRKHRTPHQ